jgi:hypothetical protein
MNPRTSPGPFFHGKPRGMHPWGFKDDKIDGKGIGVKFRGITLADYSRLETVSDFLSVNKARCNDRAFMQFQLALLSAGSIIDHVGHEATNGILRDRSWIEEPPHQTLNSNSILFDGLCKTVKTSGNTLCKEAV